MNLTMTENNQGHIIIMELVSSYRLININNI